MKVHFDFLVYFSQKVGGSVENYGDSDNFLSLLCSFSWWDGGGSYHLISVIHIEVLM